MSNLDFDPKSRVGQLYQDIRSAYLKKGGTSEGLFTEMNNGYCSSTFVPICKNDVMKIESGELFEFAYKFKDYHQYLAKHGYALPFDMNDYDPVTKVDDDLRSEIDQIVEMLISQTIEEGQLIGTDEFACILSKKIYDWSLLRFKSTADCELEALDWEALSKQCGACTEISTILFYAYDRAGLNPTFLEMYSFEPSTDNYRRFAQWGEWKAGGTGHELVSIPLPISGRQVQIDAAQMLFDPAYKYSRPETPAQAALGWYTNRQSNLMGKGLFADAVQLADRAIEINPANFLAYENKWLSLLWATMTGTYSGDESTLQSLEQSMLESDNPYIRLTLSGINFMRGFSKKEGAKMLLWLEKNGLADNVIEYCDKNPDKSAEMALTAGIFLFNLSKLVQALSHIPYYSEQVDFEQFNKAYFKNISRLFEYSLLKKPELIGNYYFLSGVSNFRKYAYSVYAIYGNLVAKYPELSLAQLLKYQGAVDYAGAVPLDNVSTILDEASTALAKYKELEPKEKQDESDLAVMEASIPMIKKDYTTAITILEDAIQKTAKPPAKLYLTMIQLNMFTGDFSKAGQYLDKYCAEDFHATRKTLVSTMRGMLVRRMHMSDGATSSGATLKLSNQEQKAFIVKILDTIAEDPALIEEAKQLFGAMMVISLLDGDTASVIACKKRLGPGPFSADTLKTMEYLLSTITDAGMAKSINKSLESATSDMATLDTIIETMNTLLTPITAFQSYATFLVMVAKYKILHGDVKKASLYLKQAVAVPGMAQFYFTKIGHDVFTGCFDACFKEDAKPDKRRIQLVIDTATVALAIDNKEGSKIFEAMHGGLSWLHDKCVEHKLAKEAKKVDQIMAQMKKRLK